MQPKKTMKEESFEYFRGTKQEIENEKKRKSALMSYFPKTLGTIDSTRYILVNDDKPNLKYHFNETNFNIPASAVISNENEKSKKKQDKTTASISGFENNLKTDDFNKWEENIAYFNPNKETEETNIKKMLFGYENDRTTVNNDPSKLSPQYKELEGMYKIKPQPNRTNCDSLELNKRNIANNADCLNTANVNYNTVSNTKNTAKSNIKPGLYGRKPKKDYTEELNNLIQELPPIAASILNNLGTEIVVLDKMFSIDESGNITPRIGRYYAKENKVYIDSEHVNEYTLLSEAIHAAQDYLGMTGSGKSNLEFQEHVIKDLYFKQQYTETYDNNEYKDYPNYSTSTEDEYDNFITSLFDENNVLDLNKFLSKINKFMIHFQKNYEQSNSYQTPAVKNYNYNWIKLLHIFGIEYKY